MDDAGNTCVIIPLRMQAGSFRTTADVNCYDTAVYLHQHLRALSTDNGKVAKLFHCFTPPVGAAPYLL